MIAVRHAAGPGTVMRASTEELREQFLVDDLFVDGEFRGVYVGEDRMVVAGIVPLDDDIEPTQLEALGVENLLDNREMGIINIGQPGELTVDGEHYELGHRDGLYAGRGSRITFRGRGAKFYAVAALAHATHPTVLIPHASVEPVHIADERGAGARALYRYVWGGGHPSCQLQIGLTVLKPNSVWNTLPPHLHSRRTEVYLYTGLEPHDRVMHFMGEPTETRHLVVSDGEAIIAPSWSVHFGAGTAPYSFIWAMAGENTDYGDLQPVRIDDLR